MGVPERSDEQRREALAEAHRVRRVQSQVKQMLKTGEITLADVLARADDADEVGRLRVTDALKSLPRIGVPGPAPWRRPPSPA